MLMLLHCDACCLQRFCCSGLNFFKSPCHLKTAASPLYSFAGEGPGVRSLIRYATVRGRLYLHGIFKKYSFPGF